MVFNSVDFIIFFPAVLLLWFIVPRKARYIFLLLASYYFYMSWNPKYAILIAISTVITYVSGIMLERDPDHRKLYLVLNCLANLGILFVFKYANFLVDNVSLIMERIGIGVIDRRLDILLPVGISFYTFQALGYTFDVYNGKIKPEKNILKYALYVSFFPQLVAGPIERSTKLLTQIRSIENIRAYDFDRIRDGLLLMLWGYFQKLFIADRASILVDTVVNDHTDYGFVEISAAVFLFAFQIYCDFGGYTNIARGAAKVLGFDLTSNFRQPYLACGIRDFWRRWHITLTSWFTDYVYIPLGGNRKGKARKYLNILIVFAVSGLWHGAGWGFVVWGLLHAIYQIAEDMMHGKADKELRNASGEGKRIVRRAFGTIVTFILVDFAWIFFVCDGITHSIGLIRQMFVKLSTVGLFELGLSKSNWLYLVFGLSVLLVVDIIREKGISIFEYVQRRKAWVRWAICLALFWITFMFGVYGPGYDTSTFIYFQF